MKKYIFARNVLLPNELFADEFAVIERMPQEQKLGIEEKLGAGIESFNMEAYFNRVTAGFVSLVDQGTISDILKIRKISESAAASASAFWGDNSEIHIRVVPSNEILAAENAQITRLEKELRIKFARPVRPSPAFADHLEGTVVVSNNYILFRGKTDEGPYSSIYFEGNAQAIKRPWDASVLRTVVNSEASKILIRRLRGESGEGYLRYFRSLKPEAWSGIDSVIGAACSYALPKVEIDAGNAALYRKILDVWVAGSRQMLYAAYATLAGDIGMKNAALFDNLFIQSTNSGPLISGSLFGEHPEHSRKNNEISESTKRLKYRVDVKP